MKRLRTIGLMMFALLALGAFAASTASAEEGLLPTQEAKEASGKGGAGRSQPKAGNSHAPKSRFSKSSFHRKAPCPAQPICISAAAKFPASFRSPR
jgi:hypothetical protein